MNILFISISSIQHMSKHSISQDLLREFCKHGHNVYVVCSIERKENKDTYLSQEADCHVLRVKIGNNKKANIIEKGLTTLLLPFKYKKEIKRFFSDVKFDLVLYPTPPITHVSTVKYIKNRDGAESYLLLKDIFPQNAVDLGMMSKKGIKGIAYSYFRHLEKELYLISDRIGCMSPANIEYLIKNNRIDRHKIEVFPNSIDPIDVSIGPIEKEKIREKYNIPQEKTVFVYGGNLGKPQGIEFVIDCLDRVTELQEAFFLIVGDGTEYKKLRNYIDQKQPKNVSLLAKLPKEDYDKMIAACDVGLLFLDHRFTIPNFPSRLLAYMQAHLPVIAATDPCTDVGKVITEGNFGWWCESNDVDAFIDLVKKAVITDCSIMRQNSFNYLLQHYQVKDNYYTIMKKEQ